MVAVVTGPPIKLSLPKTLPRLLSLASLRDGNSAVAKVLLIFLLPLVTSLLMCAASGRREFFLPVSSL